MSQTLAAQQWYENPPPRRGQIVALTVDATARSYDLTAINFGNVSYRSGNPGDFIYLAMTADGANVYFALNSATASDLDHTAAVAAGGTLAFGNTYAQVIPNGQTVYIRIQRSVDKFLQVKTSTGTTVLRINASSNPSPGTL